MKILFISNVVPNSAGGGSPRRAAIQLKALREMGQVTLVIPPLDGSPVSDIEGVTVVERGHALALVRKWRHDASHSPAKRFVHGLRRLNLADGRAHREEATQFRARLSEDFDLVFAFRLWSVLWWETVFRPTSRSVRIADLDDIESNVFARKIRGSTGAWWWRAKLRHQLRWLRRTERRVATEWDAVCLCSRLDADRFVGITGVEPWIVPNAYAFGPTAPEPQTPPCRLLFVGTFGYFPNFEGVLWFVETIWPKVRAELGEGAELALVGLDPTPAILALNGRDGITVAANVPSVDPYYAAANIVIAPLHTGSGTRIKLLEAAAKRRAIVTTTLGCEGLGFVDGVHAEIADDPADFAARIIALARDAERRAEMANACREFAEARFSQETVTENLKDRIGSTIRARHVQTATWEGQDETALLQNARR